MLAVEKELKTLAKELTAMIQACGSTLTEMPGVGPIVAARVLAEVGDVTRFADRNYFLRNKRREFDDYRRQVTQFEMERMFPVL